MLTATRRRPCRHRRISQGSFARPSCAAAGSLCCREDTARGTARGPAPAGQQDDIAAIADVDARELDTVINFRIISQCHPMIESRPSCACARRNRAHAATSSISCSRHPAKRADGCEDVFQCARRSCRPQRRASEGSLFSADEEESASTPRRLRRSSPCWGRGVHGIDVLSKMPKAISSAAISSTWRWI